MGLEQWSSVREPSLLLSNHPPLWKMIELFKDISSFSRQGDGTLVVMDAAVLGFAKRLFDLDGIPVNINKKTSVSGESGLVALRSRLTRGWGELVGAYDMSFKGMEVVDQMRGALDAGKSVFLCPTGSTNGSACWRSGVGCLVKGIYDDGMEDEIGIGLVSVVDDEYTLLAFPSMVDLLGIEFVEEAKDSSQLALGMQTMFEDLVMLG